VIREILVGSRLHGGKLLGGTRSPEVRILVGDLGRKITGKVLPMFSERRKKKPSKPDEEWGGREASAGQTEAPKKRKKEKTSDSNMSR